MISSEVLHGNFRFEQKLQNSLRDSIVENIELSDVVTRPAYNVTSSHGIYSPFFGFSSASSSAEPLKGRCYRPNRKWSETEFAPMVNTFQSFVEPVNRFWIVRWTYQFSVIPNRRSAHGFNHRCWHQPMIGRPRPSRFRNGNIKTICISVLCALDN